MRIRVGALDLVFFGCQRLVELHQVVWVHGIDFVVVEAIEHPAGGIDSNRRSHGADVSKVNEEDGSFMACSVNSIMKPVNTKCRKVAAGFRAAIIMICDAERR